MNECKHGYNDLNTGFVVAMNIEAKKARRKVVAAIMEGLIASTYGGARYQTQAALPLADKPE